MSYGLCEATDARTIHITWSKFLKSLLEPSRFTSDITSQIYLTDCIIAQLLKKMVKLAL